MKKPATFIKAYSETPCLPPERFWESYGALISVLVTYYKKEEI